MVLSPPVAIASPKARGLSSRRRRNVAVVEHIRKVHAENYGVYGVRKMWDLTPVW